MKNVFSKIDCTLALVLFFGAFNLSSAQSDISAIDVLLDPDKTMLDSAKQYNDLMRKNYNGPGSFELDATHKPHISVLQCFVKAADLDRVYAAVAEVVKREQPTKLKLTTSGFYFIPAGELGLAGITADTTSGLMRFQKKLIEVVKPFIVIGTDAGFVPNANGAAIAAGTKEYVNGFIPNHSGTKFNPHVTIGLAKKIFLEDLKLKPYNKFDFKSSSVSIYQLGDFGTAQKMLWNSSK